MTGRVTRACARHRILVLSLSALTLLVLGTGLPHLTFSDDPNDAMPRGDPNTEASYELVERFPGSSYTAAAYVHVNLERWEPLDEKLAYRARPATEAAADDAGYEAVNRVLAGATQGSIEGVADHFPGPFNITDEVYMRAQEEMYLFLKERVPGLEWGITLPSQVKLVNYTNTGIPNPVPGQEAARAPDPAAFSLPGTGPEGARQFATAWQTYFASSPDSVRTITSSDWKSARMAFLFAPGDQRLDEVGSAFYAAVQEYQDELAWCAAAPDACALAWPAFDPEDVIVDPRTPVAAASYLTETTLEDVLWLAPFAAAFVALCLLLAFRTPGTVLALMLPMALAGVGVLGIFGLVGLPIHSVSLLVFPVLLGNGIDFAIHMANAYHQARREGRDRLAAAQAAGDHAGTPLAIATLTTLVGMSLLAFAPNRLLTQLGLAIILGMALLLVVSLTSLPAALSFTRTPPAGRPWLGSRLLANARFWHRRRAAGAAVVVVLAGTGLLAAGHLDTLIVGTPATYFPPDDAQRLDFERSNAQYYKGNEDLVTNALVLRGDIATPEAMDFLARLEEGLKELEFVREESAVSLRFAMNAWVQVREGTAGAPLVIAQESARPGSTFPDDREGIKALIDEMFATPLSTYASFFVNQPDENDGMYDISIVLVEIYQAPDFEGLARQWDALHAKVREVEAQGAPSGLQVTMSGQSAVAYLFTAEEMPYLQVASLAGLGLTGILVLAVRRSLRDAATVAAVVGTSGAMWLGSLALFDVPLSIALVVPVVIIAAIGSDYALHLRYSLVRRQADAWSLVGRAVVYSAVTDLGAFLVFTQMRYGLLAQATVATAAALTCSVLATLIVVPLLARSEEVEAHPDAAPHAAPGALVPPRRQPAPDRTPDRTPDGRNI